MEMYQEATLLVKLSEPLFILNIHNKKIDVKVPIFGRPLILFSKKLRAD
jgi:hypothetical protein